ncbi:DUF4214 domain-containing protein [Quadrisphaera sp. KR29]|uniref:DUF4214 domain-containing protein n=1 Tax=Quadrisphaera sp. KR29 TaxID=3461391 RepID=UPI004044966F
MAAAALVAGTTAAAPAVAAPTDRTQVNAWYRDFLERDATADPGSQYWVDTIGRSNPADALWAITHSREYTEKQITSYYNDYLNRAPDPGASYWIDGAIAGRFPVEWAQQNILASQEFANTWSSSYGREFVARAWYLYVLSRTPNDGEVAYWAGRIDRVGRLAALRELWYSGEAVRYRVNQHYKDLLRRDADIPGLNYWYGKEVESDINVQVLLAATPEYRTTREYF